MVKKTRKIRKKSKKLYGGSGSWILTQSQKNSIQPYLLVTNQSPLPKTAQHSEDDKYSEYSIFYGRYIIMYNEIDGVIYFNQRCVWQKMFGNNPVDRYLYFVKDDTVEDGMKGVWLFSTKDPLDIKLDEDPVKIEITRNK